jgi:hypothetical protein
MKTLQLTALAAVFSAAPLFLNPAFAAGMTNDHMMSDEMHPMMHSEVTCSAGMSDTGGMMVEFHNMGKDEIPAGTTAHWMLSGVAQGDVHFMDAVAPGGMKSQNYMMADHMMHMPTHAHCSVEMMK